MPADAVLDAAGRTGADYVATYDPATRRVTRLTVAGRAPPRGLSLHGMDVVPSAADPSELLLYLINHRAPLAGAAQTVGADSVVEIFRTRVGGTSMTHVRTVEDPAVIVTPNDVVGAADGKSFYFTNDHGSKAGWVRAPLSLFWLCI